MLRPNGSPGCAPQPALRLAEHRAGLMRAAGLVDELAPSPPRHARFLPGNDPRFTRWPTLRCHGGVRRAYATLPVGAHLPRRLRALSLGHSTRQGARKHAPTHDAERNIIQGSCVPLFSTTCAPSSRPSARTAQRTNRPAGGLFTGNVRRHALPRSRLRVAATSSSSPPRTPPVWKLGSCCLYPGNRSQHPRPDSGQRGPVLRQ